MYRISVLMGVYNCAPFLQEALDSLYSQTFKGFKIILCDDGSNDGTFEIAKANAEVHECIVLIRNDKNMGLNYTLNRCLEYADTEYCARMDGDDVSLPTRFEKELSFLDTHPEYDIVSTPMIYFDEIGEFGRGRGGYEPKKDDIIYRPPFCHAPCMVRLDAYRSVGGYTVDPRLLRYEDYNLWMKMYKLNYRGYVLDECLYKMRDDRKAIHRRSLKSRMNGIYAHYLAYKELHLSTMGMIKYTSQSIIKGLMPYCVYKFFHKRQLLKQN